MNSTARLVIGTYPNTNDLLLEQATTRLRARCPQLSVDIMTDSDRALLPELNAGGVDVVFGREPSARALGSLSFQPLYEEALAFVTRPQHPLAFRTQLYPWELAPYSLQLIANDAVLVSEAQRYLSTQGLPTASLLAPDTELFPAPRLHDDSILITPLGAAASAIRRRELAQLPMERRVPHHRVGLIHPHAGPAGFWIVQLGDIFRGLAARARAGACITG